MFDADYCYWDSKSEERFEKNEILEGRFTWEMTKIQQLEKIISVNFRE